MDNPPDAGERELVRVYIIDNEPIFREALQRYLGAEPGLQVVGAAATASDFDPALEAARPDVVILDPGAHRARLACLLAELRRRCAGVGFIVMTLDFDRGWGIEALAAGAEIFVDKEHAVEDLMEAIWRVAGRR